jgi:putative ABC transport system permease protein
MRTLGAKRLFLRKIHLIEFSMLGLISGLLAIVISETVLYALYAHVMQLEYRSHFYLWIGVPLIGTLLVSLIGCWGVRKVINKSPLQVLREL